MSTNSTIGLELQNGTVQYIYCHWDGYPSNNGHLLNEYYDRAMTQELMDNGDLSCLDEYGSKGSVHYMRDKGETGCEAHLLPNVKTFFEGEQTHAYNYLLRQNGKWYVNKQRLTVKKALTMSEYNY